MSTPSDDGDERPRPDGDSGGLVRRLREFVRLARTDPTETDDRYGQLEDAETRSVERHGLWNRVNHWAQAVLFFVLLWTGLAIWTGNYAVLESGIWGGYSVAFGLHIWAGIFTLAVTFVLFPFYYIIVDDHSQLLEIIDIQVGTAIASAFLGLREYLPYYHEARRAYDEDDEDWMAHHPMQKTFFWWIGIFVGLLALTGFGMYRAMLSDPSWWIVTLGFMETWFTFELLKQAHLLLTFISASMVAFHIYFAVMPGNWDVLKSMVFGDLEAYIVRGDAAGERSTVADGGTDEDGGEGDA
ncbi:MAG: cytochrome b/b6 domain-containing protein [Halobacteriales archaeon]